MTFKEIVVLHKQECKEIIWHEVMIDGIRYKVYGNKRTEPDVFNAIFHCDICDSLKQSFVSKVIEIPGIRLKICTSCLVNMQKAISQTILDS